MNWDLEVRQHLQQRYAGLSRGKKILVWCLLAWLAWQSYRWIHRTPFMPQEIATVEQLTQPAQTVCLGRFLLDIPTSQVSKLSGTYDIDGMRIKTIQIQASAQDYQSLVAQRVGEIKAQVRSKDKSSRFLGFASMGAESQTLKYFVNHAGQKIAFESWLLFSDAIIQVTLETFEHDEDKKNDVSTRVPRLQHLLTRLERMPRDGSLPQGSGFCAGAVFVKGTEAVQEEMNVNFELAVPHDDAYIALSTNTSEASKTGLLARAAKNTALYAQSGFRYTTLRSGEKKIQDLKGEELLAKAPINDNGGISQKLVWEHQPEKASVLKPQIKFEMNTGNNENNNTSYTDAIAVGIYDRILGTLRLRPGQE
jgi:hypothetical protein